MLFKYKVYEFLDSVRSEIDYDELSRIKTLLNKNSSPYISQQDLTKILDKKTAQLYFSPQNIKAAFS
jgi:hypothetical protein